MGELWRVPPMPSPAPRNARVTSKLQGVRPSGLLGRECPVCGARPGYRCTKKVGEQVLPRKTVHDERRKKRS